MLTVTMSVIKNCVLLLKSQKTDENYDKYEELLKQSGYSVRQLKTLTFKYQNLEVLSEKLAIPENYSGIIFSSPRCVHSVHLALNGEGLDVRWKSNANFVVGEATFDAAKSKLGLICKGSETGNAENLAELIIKEKAQYAKPFLFPHGNLKTDTLHKNLGKAALEMDETLVYETVPNPKLKDEITIVSDNFTVLPEYIVFFSPSGVQSAIPFIKNVPIDWSFLKFIAIGPVTRERMEGERIPVYSVAEKPNPESVLKAISKQE